ncbi:RNA dependent RNA polymerase-domain-containing protein [Truncatella angustata]|uniref:RNA-dependent RNA polymerase n=1 Tax=Truncatella angustata TaxID=152316 RepID=A0A9P8UF76_9PEZI|nr:RNA dependent RNA polymerase-domain-containing protein [Truncatella angustata]KAH6648723.1 RNA dependent RNA polymerase-domain-containing protein [Truncatella angustata]
MIARTNLWERQNPHGHPHHPQGQRSNLDTRQDWTKWLEVSVKLEGIPLDTTALEIFQTLQAYGRIESIRIPQPTQRDAFGHAYITFSPAPITAFWMSGSIGLTINGGLRRIRVFLQNPRRPQMISSPLRPDVMYLEVMTLRLSSLDLGFLSDDRTMTVMKTIKNVLFYQKVLYVDIDQDYWCLVISQKHPPRFWKRRNNMELSHKGDKRKWGDLDTWLRTTEISYADWAKQYPVTMQEPFQFIDIGKWTTYRLLFLKSDTPMWNNIRAALSDFNIQIVTTDISTFTWKRGSPSNFREIVDDPIVVETNDHLALLHRTDKIDLSFEVRYQLEAAISQGVFNEQSITPEFLCRLSNMDSARGTGSQNSVHVQYTINGFPVPRNTQRASLINKAKNVLEYVTEADKPVYNPMTVLENRLALTHHTFITLPDHCTWVRKVIVTPSKVYFSSPSPETTNRVLRHYAKQGDRFLRVQFTDERNEGKIHAQADSDVSDALYNRVYRTLRNGIRIGDRHYQFLAFGNSQFREHGAYFFCPTATVSCNDIRDWMGDFSHIDVVAKYASRLGQCFSTTRDPRGISLGIQVSTIPDIEKNDWCFSDGVGKISPWVSSEVTKKLKMYDEHGKIPSAFQFRHGGSKGILVTWPDVKFNEICLRPSQQKFSARARNLEIVRCSRFSVATLNRQTIAILSCLGVPDEAFVGLTKNQLSDYSTAMTNPEVALRLLRQFIDENGMTTTIAQLIMDGFMDSQEPFTKALLQLWRAWSMKLLREKARIVVENGAFVFGCIDETRTLRGQENTMESNLSRDRSKLPQVFLQVSVPENAGEYRAIKGVCVVGRNPSLHPGDLRVVEAVDVDNAQLKTLRNVLVFPADGDRDVASMCSGGDLDGDDYFIFWDPKLLPQEWNHPPMMHDAVQPKKAEKSVTIRDISRFFVEYLKNDSLSSIALAHVAWADKASVKSPECLELAKLHSNAVDYVKTGQPAHMGRALRPRSWPHFMERDPQKSYKSGTILGQLYDLVAKVDFTPDFEGPFDSRILRRYKLSDNLLKLARGLKTQYDIAMRRIMNQSEIGTEFEVWSTFVMTKPRIGTDYKVQEDMGLIMAGLRDRFVQACIGQAGRSDRDRKADRGKGTESQADEHLLAQHMTPTSMPDTIPASAEAREVLDVDRDMLCRFVAAMYRVTWEEVQIAIQEWQDTRMIAGHLVPKRSKNQMPLISFPWLFEADLGRIATSGTAASMELNELPRAPKLVTAGTIHEAVDAVAATLQDGRLFHRGDEVFLIHQDVEGDNEDNSSSSGQGSTPDESDVEAAMYQLMPALQPTKADTPVPPFPTPSAIMPAKEKLAAVLEDEENGEEEIEEVEEIEEEFEDANVSARRAALQKLTTGSDED